MNLEILSALQTLSTKYGLDKVFDRRWLKSALADILKSRYDGEIRIVLMVLEKQLPQRLQKQKNLTTADLYSKAKYLASNYYVHEEKILAALLYWVAIVNPDILPEPVELIIKDITKKNQKNENFASDSPVSSNKDAQKTQKDFELDELCKWGEMYEKGQNVTQDYNLAIKYYKKVAEQGHTRAINNLTNLANQNNADAQYKLGSMYYYSRGVKRDYQKAREWYTKAANLGNADAQKNLGTIYEKGQGVTANYQLAIEWYKKAAEQGHTRAINSLTNLANQIGKMYDEGNGVEIDYQKAFSYYQQAANLGYAPAQNSLGDMYYYGHGVARNYELAVVWFRKAATQGHAEAQYNLGSMYEYGRGVPKTIN